MKKILLVFGLLVILTACGQSEATQHKTTNGDSKVKNNNVTQTTDHVTINDFKDEKTLHPPTERTVDEIPKDGHPWEYLDPKRTKKFLEDGQVVYIFDSDAPAIEKSIKIFSKAKIEKGNKEIYPAQISKEEYIDSWRDELHLLIQGTEKYYPDKKAYFDKLREVEAAMKNYDYKTIPDLVDEAANIRESQ